MMFLSFTFHMNADSVILFEYYSSTFLISNRKYSNNTTLSASQYITTSNTWEIMKSSPANHKLSRRCLLYVHDNSCDNYALIKKYIIKRQIRDNLRISTRKLTSSILIRPKHITKTCTKFHSPSYFLLTTIIYTHTHTCTHTHTHTHIYIYIYICHPCSHHPLKLPP